MDHDGDLERRPLARSVAWPAILAGATVGLVIVAVLGLPGFLVPLRTECRLGPAVGTYTVWSPAFVLNIPQGGGLNVSVSYTGLRTPSSWDGNYTMTSGSLTVGSLPQPPGLDTAGNEVFTSSPSAGGIFLGYKDINWTFYHTQNFSARGVAADPCSQPYVAEGWFSTPYGCGGFYILPLANNSSDSMEPHVWNGTTNINGSEGGGCPSAIPGSYVWFDSSLHSSGSGATPTVGWDLCGQSGNRTLQLSGTAQVPVTIWVPFAGHYISASGYLSWFSRTPLGEPPTAIYTVPSGWNWTLATVGPGNATIDPASPLPGLVAFVRSPC